MHQLPEIDVHGYINVVGHFSTTWRRY